MRVLLAVVCLTLAVVIVCGEPDAVVDDHTTRAIKNDARSMEETLNSVTAEQKSQGHARIAARRQAASMVSRTAARWHLHRAHDHAAAKKVRDAKAERHLSEFKRLIDSSTQHEATSKRLSEVEATHRSKAAGHATNEHRYNGLATNALAEHGKAHQQAVELDRVAAHEDAQASTFNHQYLTKHADADKMHTHEKNAQLRANLKKKSYDELQANTEKIEQRSKTATHAANEAHIEFTKQTAAAAKADKDRTVAEKDESDAEATASQQRAVYSRELAATNTYQRRMDISKSNLKILKATITKDENDLQRLREDASAARQHADSLKKQSFTAARKANLANSKYELEKRTADAAAAKYKVHHGREIAYRDQRRQLIIQHRKLVKEMYSLRAAEKRMHARAVAEKRVADDSNAEAVKLTNEAYARNNDAAKERAESDKQQASAVEYRKASVAHGILAERLTAQVASETEHVNANTRRLEDLHRALVVIEKRLNEVSVTLEFYQKAAQHYGDKEKAARDAATKAHVAEQALRAHAAALSHAADLFASKAKSTEVLANQSRDRVSMFHKQMVDAAQKAKVARQEAKKQMDLNKQYLEAARRDRDAAAALRKEAKAAHRQKVYHLNKSAKFADDKLAHEKEGADYAREADKLGAAQKHNVAIADVHRAKAQKLAVRIAALEKRYEKLVGRARARKQSADVALRRSLEHEQQATQFASLHAKLVTMAKTAHNQSQISKTVAAQKASEMAIESTAAHVSHVKSHNARERMMRNKRRADHSFSRLEYRTQRKRQHQQWALHHIKEFKRHRRLARRHRNLQAHYAQLAATTKGDAASHAAKAAEHERAAANATSMMTYHGEAAIDAAAAAAAL